MLNKYIKPLNYINTKLLKSENGLVPGDMICIDAPTESNTHCRYVKLLESDMKYYLVPCDQEGLVLIDSLKNEVSLDKWSTRELKQLFS